MPSETIFFEGLPATFATTKEIPWRQKLLEYKPLPEDRGYIGIIMLFVLPAVEPKGHPLDVDNLYEPVFSVLINKKQSCNDTRCPRIGEE